MLCSLGPLEARGWPLPSARAMPPAALSHLLFRPQPGATVLGLLALPLPTQDLLWLLPTLCTWYGSHNKPLPSLAGSTALRGLPGPSTGRPSQPPPAFCSPRVRVRFPRPQCHSQPPSPESTSSAKPCTPASVSPPSGRPAALPCAPRGRRDSALWGLAQALLRTRMCVSRLTWCGGREDVPDGSRMGIDSSWGT